MRRSEMEVHHGEEGQGQYGATWGVMNPLHKITRYGAWFILGVACHPTET